MYTWGDDGQGRELRCTCGPALPYLTEECYTPYEMTPQEIQATATASATKMLSWMEEQKKGRDEVKVSKIERKEGSKVFSLTIGKRLFSLESIFFKLSVLTYELDTGAVKVKYYDRDKGLLVVRPKDEYLPIFNALKKEEIVVVSDLRFLIERTKSWYEVNGAEIAIPDEASSLNAQFDIASEALSGKTPSEEQVQAIEMISTKPFSYVWGAPGTGKTQFVLAYSALRYIRAGKKVGIVAPTNLSLEQVLRGMMEMTDLEGVSRERILRLGTPTKAFANEFPEVCEVMGIQKKIDEIDAQLKILDTLQEVRAEEEDLTDLKKQVATHPGRVEQRAAALRERVEEEKAAAIAVRKKKIDVDYPDKEIAARQATIVQLVKKRDSFWTKVKSWFGSAREDVETDIVGHQKRIEELEKEKLFHQQDYDVLYERLQTTRKAKQQVERVLSNVHTQLLTQLATYDWMRDLVETSGGTVLEEPAELLVKIDDHLEELDGKAALAKAYIGYSPEMLAATRAEYEKERADLEASGTEEREERAAIIAVTLDTYIGRYANRKMEVDHLFLDEAGYANQVKALTLFNHRVPITFLGDHMQLPPVCEINDTDIEKVAGFGEMYLWAESALHVGFLFGEHTSSACRNFYLKNTHPPLSEVMAWSQLTATHRFGKQLADILSQYVYGGAFRSAAKKHSTRIRVIHALRDAKDKKNTSSGEVAEVLKLVTAMRRENPKANYVTLAPYRAQIAALGHKMPKDQKEERILTVHKSQGREWDTVILSVANASPHWFTDTNNVGSKGLNVINTAVSRAKKELIIVCNADNWGNWPGQLLHGLVSVAEEVEV